MDLAYGADPAFRTGSDAEHIDGGGEIPYDIEQIADLLPADGRQSLIEHDELSELIEVIMDYGRIPLARFPNGDVQLSTHEITLEDIQNVERKVRSPKRLDIVRRPLQLGRFNKDNRAGISGTLHRISCIRNKDNDIVGLTCRVGRDIPESGRLVEDILQDGKSILMLGAPGVGKTTAIRCMARYLSDVMKKRVIVVDTSNEIAGDGDIPHKSIGSARRMQVPDNDNEKIQSNQHKVMIEAIQNHTPEVLIIDEIGSIDECEAARIVARRGVQLIASAHGKKLKNLLHDPVIRDLLGGTQTVIRSDAMVAAKGLPKVSLERKFDPSFEVVIEMEEREKWNVIDRVWTAVDTVLKNEEIYPEVRYANDQYPLAAGPEQGIASFGNTNEWKPCTTVEMQNSWEPRDQSAQDSWNIDEFPVTDTRTPAPKTEAKMDYKAAVSQTLSSAGPADNSANQNVKTSNVVKKDTPVESTASTSTTKNKQESTTKTSTPAAPSKSTPVTKQVKPTVQISAKPKPVATSPSKAQIKRILAAKSEADILQVTSNMKIEEIKKKFNAIMTAINKHKTLEGTAARQKAQKAYKHFLDNQHKQPAENEDEDYDPAEDIKEVLASTNHYDCLQVEKTVTKKELEEIYAEWQDVFPDWKGLQNCKKAEKKVTEAYTALKKKLS